MLSGEARLKIIRPMVADGLSAAQIADNFRNASRSAVCGFCDRNNVRLLGFKSAPAKQHGNKGAPRAHAIVAKAARKRAGREPHDIKDGEGVDVTHLLGIMDLDHHTCRWPVTGEGSGTLFCGIYIPSGTYCPEHTQRSVSKAVRP
jgi:hypothetical protein